MLGHHKLDGNRGVTKALYKLFEEYSNKGASLLWLLIFLM